MAEDVTEPVIPLLTWQPRAVLDPTDYADILEGQFFQWRIKPSTFHKFIDDDQPVTDPVEDLIRREFNG